LIHAKLYGVPAARRPALLRDLLEAVDLTRFGKSLVSTFSGGMRRRLEIARGLVHSPKILFLDEPTTGLDPVARHEMLIELMDVLRDERRAILFSSHNTQDVEQISDQITFIDRGRIIDSSDKETFIEQWRRLKLEVPNGVRLPTLKGVVEFDLSGHIATVTTNAHSEEIVGAYANAGAIVHDVQRMTLEEIFVANVMASRKERAS
jgi:ABC-2 type transport system ATP-binding protein